MSFQRGEAQTDNFNSSRLLKHSEMPQVSVMIVNSGAPLGGVGESGEPPIAPAVANAWARLTGKRIRTLPVFPGGSILTRVF